MSSHRYWRLYFTAGTTVTLILSEVDFFLDGVSQTGFGVAYSSDDFNSATMPVSFLFDKNNDNSWASNTYGYPHWVKYDFGLGNEKIINSYSIKVSNSEMPKSWVLQYSDNDVSWTTIHSTEPIIRTFVENETKLYTFDPYFSNVSLLLPMIYNFIDHSPTLKPIFVNGNTSISSSKSKWGPGSGYFDGSGDYLTITPQGDEFIFGTGDFTIECWVYYTGSGWNTIFGNNYTNTNNNSYWLGFSIPNVKFIHRTSSGIITNLTSSVISSNSWHFISVSRNGANLRLFVDGNIQSTDTNFSTAFVGISGNSFVGVASISMPDIFSGYIQDLRITKGVARYTANFTPPSEPFYYFTLIFNYQLLNNLITYNPGAVSGSIISLTYNPPLPMKDYEDGGTYFIEGYVTVDSTPSSRKVRLHCLNNGRFIRQCWSDPVTGFYRFAELKDKPYYVWSEEYSSSQEKSFKVVNNTSGNNFDFFSGNNIDVSASASRYYLSGNAKLRNGIKVTQINILSFPSGTFISSITPESNGNYSIYLNKGSEYIFLFIGPQPYKPESYYYKVPE